MTPIPRPPGRGFLNQRNQKKKRAEEIMTSKKMAHHIHQITDQMIQARIDSIAWSPIVETQGSTDDHEQVAREAEEIAATLTVATVRKILETESIHGEDPTWEIDRAIDQACTPEWCNPVTCVTMQHE